MHQQQMPRSQSLTGFAPANDFNAPPHQQPNFMNHNNQF